MSRVNAPSQLRSRLAAVLGAWALLALTSGCGFLDFRDGGPESVDAGVVEGCFANSAGTCVAATSGCSPESISGGNGERCASCSEGGESFEICGAPTVGTCFQVEDPEPCTRCFTDDGATVYSDCGDVAATAVLDCEQTVYEPTPDQPNGESCEVCRDGTGRVVSETCGLELPDECHEETVEGRACEVCTRDGQEVSFVCEAPTLSEPPRVCESYASDTGSCVDCYGADDQLLLHECTFGEGADVVAFCETITEPSGLVCERCLNDDGFVVTESCDVPQPGLERCQDLSYEFDGEFIGCFVCVDEQNVFTVADCWSSQCNETDPGDPAGGPAPNTCAPPACSNSYENGQACRTCTSATGDSSTQCVAEGDIYCQEEEVFFDPPPSDPGDPNEPAPPAEVQVCTVCRDTQTGEEVYRDEDCGAGTGGVVCEPAINVDGTPCEICYDDFGFDPIYSTCGDNSMCGVELNVSLLDPQGGQLFLPSSEANGQATPAVADCSFCEAGVDSFPLEDGGYCVMQREACAVDSDDTEPVPCSSEVPYRLAFDLTQCADPWGASDGIDGLLNAMTWALREHELVTFSVSHTLPNAPPAQCEACDCGRGDTFLFELSYDDAQRLLALNLGFYESDDGSTGIDPPPPQP